MKITVRRNSWKGAATAALLLIGLVAVPAAPAQATFHAKNGRIAFRRFLNEERTWGAVFTIQPDGTDERQITNPPEGFVDRNPDVSPDGRRIAFEREHVVCDAVCSDEIFVVDADGSHLTQLTFNPPDKDCLVEGAHLQRITGLVARRTPDRLQAPVGPGRRRPHLRGRNLRDERRRIESPPDHPKSASGARRGHRPAMVTRRPQHRLPTIQCPHRPTGRRCRLVDRQPAQRP